MGLRLTHNGVPGYVKIETIMVAERDANHFPMVGTQLPHRLNVFYTIYEDKGGRILTRGDLAIDYDLSIRNENILQTAYRELKAYVPMFKDATDDI